MKYTRREMLAACAAPALAMCSTLSAADPSEKRKPLGVVSDSYAAHMAADRARGGGGFADPLFFLEHCHGLSAGGIQFPFGTRDRDYTQRLRAKAEAYQMYMEGSIGLPRDQSDIDRFTAEVRTAKEAGATVIRTFTLGGRRYETFATAETFHEWADRAFQRLVMAERVVARHKMRLAVENHKDWRIDEMLTILKRLDSRHVGVCVDTGNSIALLEDPYEVVEAYATWAFSTHLKDMAIAEYEQGFLLSEVPLGEGFLDVKRIIATLVRARPEVRFNLEMITRDPLKIPCLNPKYWATFDSLTGKQLAHTLTMVRKQAARKPLPTSSGLSQEQKLELEEKNVRQSLTYAHERLEF
jgi:sugar phosphate isomerase/epimerase